jgi:ribosome-associated translation inhibitor RaiA
MKIVIQHAGVPSSETLDGTIEKHLFALAGRLRIDAATVLVERRWSGGKAYRVAAHIETPGPDVKAEGADQTLNAAILKFVRHLDEQVHRRISRRIRRATGSMRSSSTPFKTRF